MSSDTQVIHLQEFEGNDPDGDGDDLKAPRRAPTQVGPYRIIRQLGRGGMGTVYLAEAAVSCPVPMGRPVAIKVLRRTDPEERRRFEREAAYLQSLRHPGIVRVLDSGEHEGRPFLVMQLIDGKRLDDLVLKGPLSERLAAEYTVQALEALHVAHLAGILHRDIKPGNIMLDEAGVVRILDFGLASHMHHESRLTRTGNVVGTPAYMSPEQASGSRDDVGRRSDVYSMGACLYELLTAFQPFTADNSVAVLRRIIDDPLVPPSQLRPGLSRELETVVMVAMAKDPRDRYATAEAMAEDLRRYLASGRVKAKRLSPGKVFLRSCWRHRRHIAAGSLAAFVALSAAGLGAIQLVKAQRAADARNAPPEPPAELWTTEKRIDTPLDAQGSGVHLSVYGPLGEGVQLATLPPVSGSARLTVTAELTATVSRVELFVNDRDVSKGYRLRLDGAEDGDRLVLMREDKVVASRALGRVARGQPWKLSLEREDAVVTAIVTARLNELPPLRFLDLVPIDGEDASATYVAYAPGSAAVRKVLVERQKRPLMVSALATGDMARQDGHFARAQKEYEAFLRDHPDSPQARDASLRIGLCLEGLKDDKDALTRFIDVAQANKDDPRYVLVATFHAWGCALRLGRYEEAERSFDKIRSDYDLDTLVASIPEDTRKELLQDYLDRAEKLAAAEPQRATRLYSTATDLAVYLKVEEKVSQGRTGAGDILVGLGRFEDAKALYFSSATDQHLPVPLRMKAMLKVAEVERLNDLPSSAETAYLVVMNNPTADQENNSQWARLWLGDLYLEQSDRDRALAVWRASPEALTRPGQAMARLAAGDAQLTATEVDRFYANDIEYFNGRLALMAGDAKRYADALSNVVHMGPAYDWPTPLAKHLLEVMKAAPPIEPPPPGALAPVPRASEAPAPSPAPSPAAAPAASPEPPIPVTSPTSEPVGSDRPATGHTRTDHTGE